MNLLTSPHITWQSRNTFINIYSIITKNYKFLSMTALGHHYSVYYRKMLVRLWYMLNRTLKTNVEPPWPLRSNLELRWPPFVCHVIWAVFATRNAWTFVRSEDSEPFVRRTSWMKKRAYERILTFGTAQSNTPNVVRAHAGEPIRLLWDKHNAPLLLFMWKMLISPDLINMYVLESICSRI